jgi:two-component sensor histidine kinase
MSAAILLTTNVISRIIQYLIEDERIEAVRSSMKELNILREKADIYSKHFASDPKLDIYLFVQNIKKLQEFLPQLIKESGIDFVSIIDDNGFVLANGYEEVSTGQNCLDETGINSALKGDIISGLAAGKEYLNINSIAPVKVGERILGVVRVGYQIDDKVAEEIKRMVGTDICVFRGNLITASTFNSENTQRIEMISQNDSIYHKMIDLKETHVNVLHFNKVSYASTFTLLKDIYGNPIGMLLVSVPIKEMLTFKNTTLIQLLISAIIAILIVVVVGYSIARRITKPIDKLLRTTHKVASGDLTARTQINTLDEIGNLALSFDQMAENLSNYIAELKRAEEVIKSSLKEKEVLLQEIHHRVKNNLQIISSLLNLQSRDIRDEKMLGLFKDCQNRVRSMGYIHESLYKTKDLASIDFAEYIKTLTNNLYHSYITDKSKISMTTNVKNISLTIDTAIPCGLIINELVSNALKHAFPSYWKDKGKIEISLQQNGDDEIELIVKDNGVGISENIDFRKSDSLGLKLLTTLVEDQLHGMIVLNRETGTTFLIRFKAI